MSKDPVRSNQVSIVNYYLVAGGRERAVAALMHIGWMAGTCKLT
jgi:hypothetical protein